MAKLIIGLAGEMAAGKTASARYLTEKHGAANFRFSTPMREVLTRLYVEETRENLSELTLALLKLFGDDLLSRVIARDVAGASGGLVVIDGVRRLPDIVALQQLPEFKLVYLEAAPRIRYERLAARGENADDLGKTWEEFQKDQERGTEIQIRSLKDSAQVVINNDGDQAALRAALDQLVAGC